MIYQGKSLSVKLIDNNIAELNYDREGKSVNKFDAITINELKAAVKAIANTTLSGLIITSKKPTFIVGADVTEIAIMSKGSGNELRQFIASANTVFSAFEDLPIPTVAVINGYALGGGFEMTLACDYRVLSTTGKTGLPEIKLGIYPGFGGTVRLPRIIGVDNAVEWIVSGAEQKPNKALADGAVDVVVEPELLMDASLNLLQQCMNGTLDYNTRRQKKKAPLILSSIEQEMAFNTAKAMTSKLAESHYPAPLAAVSVMEKTANMGRDEALRVEADALLKIVGTDVADALTGMFLNDQLIRKKAENRIKYTRSVKQIAVLGAGIMGGGIACQTATKGIDIVIKDVARESLEIGLTEANKLLSKRVVRGLMSPQQMGEILNRINPTLNYSELAEVELIVEAVVENPEIKCQVLSEVEGIVSEDTIITSNTSTISINVLAKSLKRPQNFCGMHFFNPVHAMPLVEVIRGNQSSDDAVAKVVAYATAIGKKTIVVNDCPGFLVNRVLSPYFAVFVTLIKEGADFQIIDRIMEKWGMPMGPAHIVDVVGIDTITHAALVMAEAYPDRLQNKCIDANQVLFEAKRYGQKNEKGFYNYKSDKKGKLEKYISEESYNLLKPHVDTKKDFDDEEIVARMMVPMCIEMVRCLDEDIVETSAEADMALIYGIGFPAFRGGLCRWMDSIKLQNFCDLADKYSHLGKLYEPTASMREMAVANHKFYP